MNKFKKLIICSVLLLILSEIVVQLSGLVDTPIYIANNQIGYIPAPNQSGKFMRLHAWHFNELSMGVDSPFSPNVNQINLLLIGDSIVAGGNPINEPDRLGPQLEAQSGWRVWPISAGSWALQNELTYIRMHPEILNKIDAIVFVSNSGDFGVPSSWSSDITHPLKHPFPGLVFLFRKYIVYDENYSPQVPINLKVQERVLNFDIINLSNKFSGPIFFFLYPTKEQLLDSKVLSTELYSKISVINVETAKNITIFKIADSLQWDSKLYRDGIHPNALGDKVLAVIIRDSICGIDFFKENCH